MAKTEAKTVRVYVVEEQAIYQEVYRMAFSADTTRSLQAGTVCPIELLGVASDCEFETINRVIESDRPDVLLLSTRKITPDMVTTMEQIRTNYHGIGMALFLKQSVDLSEQMCSIIIAVRQGQVILDPTLSALLLAGKPEYPVLKQLTARELEILSLLARGNTNGAIAQSLYIDVKTVEHHINSMYSKLKTSIDFNSKHSRVSAARLYLEATGELLAPALAR